MTFWDVQSGISFNYGFNEHIELAFSPILYQDNHVNGDGFNFIDDIFLTLKFGSYGKKGSSVKYGIDVSSRLPTAKFHNVVFEPYSANKVGFGANSRFSYARDPLYPDDATSFHLNLGYWNHNDVGEKLTQAPDAIDTVRVLSPSQEFRYGAGVVLPTDKFDFSLEIYGVNFLQTPPSTA